MNKLYINKEIISSIFVVSMIIILFTQLRIFNLPIGFGEFGLLLLGLIIFLQLLIEKKNIFFQFKHLFIVFWVIIFITLILSYLWVNIMNIHSTNTNVIHDIMAYGFVMYCILLFILLDKHYNLDFGILVERISYYSLLFYGILLGVTYCFGDVLGITLKYENIARYVGLSSNANQLALVFTIIPFLILFYNKEYKTNLYDNININLLLFILSIFIIYWISSRGLILALVIMFILVGIFYLYQKYNKIILWLYIALLSLIILNYDLIIHMLFIKGIGSFEHRIELWTNAIELFQLSPLIGFGPGAHVSTVVNLSHYWEVHNTFLDLLLQVGIIGLSLYIFLLYKIGKNLFVYGNILLFAAFCVLILFSSVHFVLRHPIFWLYLFYFYQVGKHK